MRFPLWQFCQGRLPVATLGLHETLSRSHCTASQAEPILEYVKSIGKEQRQSALDVLEGGISREQDATTCGAVRLNTAVAELHVVGNKPFWHQAAEAAEEAMKAEVCNLQEPSQHSWASAVQLRAMAALAMGQDAELRGLQARLSQTPSLPSSLTEKVLMACQRHVDVLWHQVSGTSSQSTNMDALTMDGIFGVLEPLPRAMAITDSALSLFSEGRFDVASHALSMAEDIIGSVESNDTSGALLFAPWWRDNLRASTSLARAQVAMARKQWVEAEEVLNTTLANIEGARGPAHWSISVPLLHTAYVYSRTGRVVLAEGLYRESLKLLNASVDGSTLGARNIDVHPSWTALAGWRFAQLLTVMPRRESEAQRWAELARASWGGMAGSLAGVNGSVEQQLGSLDAFSGKGTHGRLVVPNLMIGRVFPSLLERS